MSRIQKLMSAILPRKWVADMEAESRSWILHCEKCGFEQSIWDIGGIRWKATPKKKILWRCTNCHQWSWHGLTRRQQEQG